MQILLSCAKDMTTRPELSPALSTTPRFLEEARRHALQLAAFTEEMTRLFDWKRVKREVNVLEPRFFVRDGHKLKTIVAYAKMCRGAMTRHILQNCLTTRNELTTFSYEEFRYQPGALPAKPDVMPFVLEVNHGDGDFGLFVSTLPPSPGASIWGPPGCYNLFIFSRRKSSILMYCTPRSSVHGRILSRTTTILV